MFDPSAPHIIILLIVVLLLFGARRLPGAAKSLGESMHIFKRSVQGMNDDDDNNAQDAKVQAMLHQTTLPAPQLTPAQPAFDPAQVQQAQAQQAQSQQAQSQQLADLQRQLNDIQRQNGGSNSATVGGTGAPMSEAQHGQQPF
ncbi:MAG TPA: Sec-independent protein translocase subunit TatA [Streptosporangiaceae bacterium]